MNLTKQACRRHQSPIFGLDRICNMLSSYMSQNIIVTTADSWVGGGSWLGNYCRRDGLIRLLKYFCHVYLHCPLVCWSLSSSMYLHAYTRYTIYCTRTSIWNSIFCDWRTQFCTFTISELAHLRNLRIWDLQIHQIKILSLRLANWHTWKLTNLRMQNEPKHLPICRLRTKNNICVPFKYR